MLNCESLHHDFPYRETKTKCYRMTHDSSKPMWWSSLKYDECTKNHGQSVNCRYWVAIFFTFFNNWLWSTPDQSEAIKVRLTSDFVEIFKIDTISLPHQILPHWATTIISLVLWKLVLKEGRFGQKNNFGNGRCNGWWVGYDMVSGLWWRSWEVVGSGCVRENLCGQEEKGSVVGFKKEERGGGAWKVQWRRASCRSVL